MTRHQLERIYGMRELTRILTLTPRRTAQLRRLELLHGESGYTFRDLLALRAASALLDAGASVRQIGRHLRRSGGRTRVSSSRWPSSSSCSRATASWPSPTASASTRGAASSSWR